MMGLVQSLNASLANIMKGCNGVVMPGQSSVLKLMMRNAGKKYTTKEIALTLDMSQASATRAVRKLMHQGLILCTNPSEKKRGTTRILTLHCANCGKLIPEAKLKYHKDWCKQC